MRGWCGCISVVFVGGKLFQKSVLSFLGARAYAGATCLVMTWSKRHEESLLVKSAVLTVVIH